MIPVIMIILGLLMTLTGIVFIILIRFSPNVVKIRSIFGFLELEEDKRITPLRQKHRRELTSYSIVLSLIGIVVAVIGWCWGFAEKGENFWFYRKYKEHIISEETPGEWDKISEDGKYTDNNGNKYTYYIVIKGKDIKFCKDDCSSAAGLREKLSSVPRENTIIIADSYAVASEVESVKALLTEMGFKYETEEV